MRTGRLVAGWTGSFSFGCFSVSNSQPMSCRLLGSLNCKSTLAVWNLGAGGRGGGPCLDVSRSTYDIRK